MNPKLLAISWLISIIRMLLEFHGAYLGALTASDSLSQLQIHVWKAIFARNENRSTGRRGSSGSSSLAAQ